MPGFVANQRIAIVDDDPSVCSALRSLLRSLGYAVAEYPSADAFLAADAAADCDCVVTDVHMPGTSGIELACTLAHMHPALPVIVMTARGETQCLAQAAACGARALLRKPFEAEQLLAEVECALADRRSMP